MKQDEEVQVEEQEDEEYEVLDWNQIFTPTSAKSEEDEDEEVVVPPPAEPEVDDVTRDATELARLRAKYPQLFQSKEGQEPTKSDVQLAEKLMDMTEAEFRDYVINTSRSALVEEVQMKRRLKQEVLGPIQGSISNETIAQFEQEVEAMDTSQVYTLLSNKDSLEWTRDALIGKEVRRRGAKIPKQEPSAPPVSPSVDLDTSDPVINLGMKMFGLTPEEVASGKARMGKSK